MGALGGSGTVSFATISGASSRATPAWFRALADRVSGSADLYKDDGREPYHSINFVTCHDGFTLADLVAYNDKHNQANGEENRDGANDNHSWNCGVEGARRRSVRFRLFEPARCATWRLCSCYRTGLR